MSVNQHYEDELSYLRDLGDLFARENPKLAPFLSRDSADPDVERLLEGFAFLVARLRQRLDDELPELAHGLIRLVWPHYLRPIPPTTMVAFEPAPTAGGRPVQIPRGAVVQSRPVSEHRTACPFTTCYDTTALPLRVAKVELENQATRGRLTLTLAAAERASLACLSGGRVRLFFNTEREPSVGRALYLWLLRHVRRISVEADGAEPLSLPPEAVTPVGFRDDEAVIPAPANAFSGFRLLQEYLTLPQKFMFVDISGLAPVAEASGREVRLVFETARPFPAQLRVSERHIALNTTPAVNLFAHEALPLVIDHSKTEYRVLPSGGPAYSIHSVEEVTGWVQGQGVSTVYLPFESFRHDLPDTDDDTLYFRARVRPSVVGRRLDQYVSFVTRLDMAGRPESETVALRLTCSNGPVSDIIPIGGVDQSSGATPGNITFTNITAVTPETPPPLGDNLLWRLIANLARNYGSVLDVDALRTVIAAYDFRAIQDSQARRRLELLLEGLESFSVTPMDAIVRGIPVRSRQIELRMAETKVGGEGEMFLLGSVLDAFFAAYAGVNSLHRFAVSGAESSVVYEWTPRTGEMLPL